MRSVVRSHHERWDGNGYPDRLAGEEISLEARIVSVADAFDAMTSVRPYRDAMPKARALETLREGRGTQWDAVIVDEFVKIAEKLEISSGSPAFWKPRSTDLDMAA
jgi:HD-GYP domain-containing protein (c-di-GMP phosphodiesterase class II)